MHTHLSHDTQKMPNSEEEQIATDAAEREQRVLAHYAEPRGGKERTAGLKLKEQRKISLLFFVTVVIIVNLENLVLKQKRFRHITKLPKLIIFFNTPCVRRLLSRCGPRSSHTPKQWGSRRTFPSRECRNTRRSISSTR